MPSNRTRKIWGYEARGAPGSGDSPASCVEDSPKARRQRAKFKRSFKDFYQSLIAPDVKGKRTGRKYRESLGKIHDLLMDFLNLNRLKTVQNYTKLKKWLPPKDRHGVYPERWLYFRTLGAPPEIQDGPTGKLTTMFRESFWQGVLIRIKGEGNVKCVLIPRGHLKSTICTQAYTLWNVIREPLDRHLIKSLTGPLAAQFLGDIQGPFYRDNFRKLFGDLGPPPKREGPWSTEFMQVYTSLSSASRWKSRGKEATVSTSGVDSEKTGGHYDFITLDDVVGETNFEGITRRKICDKVENLTPLLENGGELLDVGTKWEFDDAHSLFTDAAMSDISEDASFIVATVLDGDQTVPVSKKVSPLGYGKPIWPEGFSIRDIEHKRRGYRQLRPWVGQYFNQFWGTSLQVFAKEWVDKAAYEGSPAVIVADVKPAIYLYFDTASGLEESKHSKLDYSCGLVLGQSPDRRDFYVLGGFCEQLPAALIAKGIVDLASQWQETAAAKALHFEAGVETTAYIQFLKPLLDHLFRDMGVDKVVSVKAMTHKNAAKADRIKKLALPHSEYRVHWPKSLMVKPVDPDAEPYDLIQILMDQYTKWPGIEHDDLLDTFAGAMDMTIPHDYAEEPEVKKKAKHPSVYTREQALEETADVGLGYDDRDRELDTAGEVNRGY